MAAVRWFRVVLDEAHEIRNRNSLVAKACWKLEGERKWCMSGTPLQNKLDDFYSYLCFLKCIPYSEYSSFCFLLKNQNSTYASLGKTKLEILLRVVLLQRMKGEIMCFDCLCVCSSISLFNTTIMVTYICILPACELSILWCKINFTCFSSCF